MKYVTWTVAQERLEELISLWNKELGQSFPMREELFKQNSLNDPNILWEGSFIALNEHDKVVGFIISKLWQEAGYGFTLGAGVGWIHAQLVDSDYRNLGIGRTLLAKAEEALREKGAKKVLLGRDPWHYFPGIPVEFASAREWFEKRGYFYCQTATDLHRAEIGRIGNSPFQEALPQVAGVSFGLMRLEDKEKLIDFLHRCFPGRWEYEAITYFEKGGTGREFVVIEEQGEIIGFCRINAPDSPFIAQNVYWAPLFDEELGGIGPLGIDRKHRGHGYGLAIVKAGIHFLQQRGVQHIVIDWTELIAFYGKLGFKPWKSYAQYEKELV